MVYVYVIVVVQCFGYQKRRLFVEFHLILEVYFSLRRYPFGHVEVNCYAHHQVEEVNGSTNDQNSCGTHYHFD